MVQVSERRVGRTNAQRLDQWIVIIRHAQIVQGYLGAGDQALNLSVLGLMRNSERLSERDPASGL
jgi:hypothetical protein